MIESASNLYFLLYLGDAASSVEFLKDKEYLGTVQDMHLNGDYCAVRFDGKILLHVLEGKDYCQFSCGILKMVGPKMQKFCPGINLLEGICFKTILR